MNTYQHRRCYCRPGGQGDTEEDAGNAEGPEAEAEGHECRADCTKEESECGDKESVNPWVVSDSSGDNAPSSVEKTNQGNK